MWGFQTVWLVLLYLHQDLPRQVIWHFWHSSCVTNWKIPLLRLSLECCPHISSCSSWHLTRTGALQWFYTSEIKVTFKSCWSIREVCLILRLTVSQTLAPRCSSPSGSVSHWLGSLWKCRIIKQNKPTHAGQTVIQPKSKKPWLKISLESVSFEACGVVLGAWASAACMISLRLWEWVSCIAMKLLAYYRAYAGYRRLYLLTYWVFVWWLWLS